MSAAGPLVGSDEGRLITPTLCDVTVKGASAEVRPPAGEPPESRRLVLEDPVRRPEPPHVLVGDATPELFRIIPCLGPQACERMLVRHVGLRLDAR